MEGMESSVEGTEASVEVLVESMQASMEGSFMAAPRTNKRRNGFILQSGQTHVCACTNQSRTCEMVIRFTERT